MNQPAESFPRLRARTQRFTLGEPRTVTVCDAGRRILFLRAAAGDDSRTGLWALDLPDGEERAVVDPAADDNLTAAERARRERVREAATGVVSYAVDDAGKVAAYVVGGQLHTVDVDTGEVRVIGGATACFDPRPDPSGRRIAYVDGGDLRIVDVDGSNDRALATAAVETVTWGRAEFVAAEEMERFRGFWWSPDGDAILAARVDEEGVPRWWIADPAQPQDAPHELRYPAAGTANAEVTLWLIGVDGQRREVGWDRSRYPYLARVSWSIGRPPLIAVVTRDQRAVAVMTVDVETGTTASVYEDTSPTWVEVFDGVPAWYGAHVVRVADVDDSRRLMVGDRPVTSPELYVRSVLGFAANGVVFQASDGDPTRTAVYRWSGADVVCLTPQPGVHRAVASGLTVVISSAALDSVGTRTVVHAEDVTRELSSYAVRPPIEPAVRLLRLGARDLAAGLVLPSGHRPGTKLPVVLDPYGGPHAQRVVAARSAWLEPQWLADQGFAVLVVDGRGSPGRDPAWEHAIHRDFAGPVLDDQIDALHAAAEQEPDLDLSRVGIRGWSFGGWLAALAVLRRPEVFAAAIAGAPVTDWALYDTFYTERYLGAPQDDPDVYRHNSLIEDAPLLDRPLLLIHGLADDNVVAAHTLRLSQRLTEAGRPHTVLPLTGVTHMTPQEAVAENLLLLQVEFLRRHLDARRH